MSLRKSTKSGFDRSGDGKVAFLTGGNGRMGRSLSTALLERGYTVRALSHNKDFMSTMPAGVIPYVGEVTDKKLLNEACRGADLVFHLAAIVSEYKEPTRKLYEVNVQGTESVIGACRQNSVGHVVFSSTVDVYGYSRKDVLTEDSELRPTDKYGYSKMLAERKFQEYHDKIDYTILRIATLYGRGYESNYFKLFKAVKEGKAYLIGSGKNHLSLIHVDDVVAAMLLAAEKRRSSHNVYNLTDGMHYTQEELFNLAADELGVDRPKKHISPVIVKLVAKNRNLDSDELRFLMSNRIIDISRIKSELGYRPSVNIKEAGAYLVKQFLKSYR